MNKTGKGIGSWLTRREELTPDKDALVFEKRHLTFKMLNKEVNHTARVMLELGIKNGDCISILDYNSIEFVEVIMAAAKIGAVVVPLNWRLTPAELSFMLKDSSARILFFSKDQLDLAKGIIDLYDFEKTVVMGKKEELGARVYEELKAIQCDDEPEPDIEPDMDSPHIIMYTAGTTGKPKGAILTQGASFWNALNLQLATDLTSRDRNLVILPMFHIGGIGIYTLPMLYVGGTSVIMRTFDPGECLRLLKKEKISILMGVSANYLFLIQDSSFDPDAFQSCRFVMSGGAPLPVSIVKQYDDVGITLTQGFGMSECAPSVAVLDKDLAVKKAGSIGQPVFHLNARIVDKDMNDVPKGQVGELIMKGPNIMKGYLNRPDANKDAFTQGWFHSGDLARMDEDGDLYIVDRKKDMFISGGENVYPAEVENSIYKHAHISEAAVVGIPNEKWGEIGCAVIVVKQGKVLSEQDVIQHLSKNMAKYKIPKKVFFTQTLPRNAVGKVLKNKLRDTYA